MAIDADERACSIVLHDDSVSTDDVLCGLNILASGDTAYLVAPGAKTLCVRCKNPAPRPDEVSVHVSVAKLFGFDNRMKASIQMVKDLEKATATHVEVSFRDQHLSRADMWRIKSHIDSSVLHEGQKLSYLGTAAASVETIYISGVQVSSAFAAHPQTNLIFRSISARFTILIQISKEMLEYWNGGNLLYETMLFGFLPQLFHRWDQLKVRHQVSVVLFGRRLSLDTQHNSTNATVTNDFFHVVALDTPSGNWRQLLRKLKRAFNDPNLPRELSLAASGNMLEAIHMAAMDFADSNIDPRFTTTGGSVVAITAGAGLFQADYNLLKYTTRLLIGSNTGVDIVCLSPKPLHPVPLFKYTRQGKEEYALPHWLDISYWSSERDGWRSRWLHESPESQMNDIKIKRLERNERYYDSNSIEKYMSSFDDELFASRPSTAIDNSLASKTEALLSSYSTERNGATESLGQIAQMPIDDSSVTSTFRPETKDRLGKIPSPASTQTLKATKKTTSQPHALMQIDRKISVGPRGLAPSAAVASTTVSAHHAQQGKETASSLAFTTNETTSGLAKQIKETLRRKPSQQSLGSRGLPESSKPVDIPRAEDKASESTRDPASLMEQAIMNPSEPLMDEKTTSLSSTPRARPSSESRFSLDALDIEGSRVVPWLRLLNPSNPRQDNMQVAIEYRQWQSVFPHAVGSDVFKWKSLCSPAALPLITDGRLSLTDLEKHLHKKVRRLVVTSIATSINGAVQHAMWQLIAIRLSAGFQAVSSRKLSQSQMLAEPVDRMLLSLGGDYHEIRCLSDSEIQITEYERQPIAETSDLDQCTYTAKVKTEISRREVSLKADLAQLSTNLDWPTLDDECVNAIALATDQGLCRMRFVLIPVEPLRTGTQGSTALRELSDDERRLEGIQKLTQLWQRHRYFADGDQRHQASMVKPKISASKERDPNPLSIEYQTRDTSAVVGVYKMNLTGQVDGDSTSRLFTESEQYHTSNFDIVKLTKQMQEQPPEGVEFKDRRWLARMHLKCFRGDEMTNWLLRVFKDLQTREDAVALGNQFMDRDIFSHVRGRHEFRDGNYFYQIKAAYRTTDYPDTTGFFSKPLGRSVPSTPAADQKYSPSGPSAQIETDTIQKDAPTPTLAPADSKKRKEILLSQKLQYNVDPGRKSSQVEIVNLHYDRIHNPENCYHIHLDWTSTTPKLIRESVARWAAAVENHGLRLVQLPMEEACEIHEHHPFDQTIAVRLASSPPDRPLTTPQLHAQNVPALVVEDSNAYHKAILRKNGFVLDLEPASSFPRSVSIAYSWGQPDYKYTQFVHKSGLLLAQIVNDGKVDFLLLPNRLAQQSSSAPSKKTEPVSVESIAESFYSFCRNAKALATLFEDLNKASIAVPSPFATAVAADADVPPIELPPHLNHRSLLKHTG